ncbi:MAG TPA: T9SS type A sorting domain-containing protein [Bacteroidales bacterium]|nr:T9SS type A sorting domain-containing protein [Bacteroidales bacterium]
MKSKKLLFGIGLLSIVAALVVVCVFNGNAERKYNPKNSVIYKQGIDGAYQWLSSIRSNQVTGTISMADILNARKAIAQLNNYKSIGIQWENAGPDNVGGRTRAILVDKDNSNLLFAGGVAGGLFKSTTGGTSWEPVPGMTEVNICCIAQSPRTGYLYVGTGESFAWVDGISGTPGFVGSGLYESTDGGVTWNIFNNATPAIQNSQSVEWAFVNRISIDPVNGRIYAATNKGLRYCDEGSTTWVNPIYLNATLLFTANANCVDVASDRSVVVAIGNKVYFSPGGSGNGEPHTFNDISPVTGVDRTELAIAPSDPNIMYACIATTGGALKGIYRTTDKGEHWTVIGPGGSSAFNLFGTDPANVVGGQGSYDNVIAVNPVNPNQIFVGGIRVWEWHLGSQFTQITIGSEDYDAHVDMHAIVFDKKNPNIFYLGSDGGVAKTTNLGQTFQTINKNYNVTQFYSVAINGTTGVMSGTQDNSSPYVSGTGLYPKKGKVLYGGDGGWSAFSFINPDAFFGTMQYAGIWRSPDRGETYQEATKGDFMSPTMIGTTQPGEDGANTGGPFITPLLHWESFNNTYSSDYTWYIDTVDHVVGDHIIVKSRNNLYPFDYIITPGDGNLAAGDTLMVQDIISSHFFVGTATGVWYTRGAIQFGSTPDWYNLANISNPHTMTISKDGNYLFVGTVGGALYRISNILAISDSLSGWYTSPYCVVERSLIRNFGQAVTNIAVDPNNPQRLLVTLGNYGNTNYVYYCDNALDFAPVFTSKQGTTNGKKLPAMPVYSAIFEMNNPNMVIIGTEYGIFSTQDITQSSSLIEWTEENNGMARVPVFGIRQQVYNYPGVTNWGAIYIGTHGKGFYKTADYLGINDNSNAKDPASGSLNIYPNPAIDNINISYSLVTKSSVTIKIYDINGKLVKLLNLPEKPNGNQIENINCSNFQRGTYIVQLIAGNSSRTAKFVITK